MAGGFERVAAKVIGIETTLNMVHNLPEFSSLCVVEEVDPWQNITRIFCTAAKWWIGWTDDVLWSDDTSGARLTPLVKI